ncbi:Uncharacterised protein [Urinicoccus massiliensis]|uniref:Uncharacterized protein n=1 Tax=Urinicoccus massiliensis TaxID=1723382 RepID=A0A8H2QSR1_9FIRM|nr:hypothetical protein [Urinicoccus massiliensis]VFB17186.1 Uncharacterised protein [Urinicoccus massiliensis]
MKADRILCFKFKHNDVITVPKDEAWKITTYSIPKDDAGKFDVRSIDLDDVRRGPWPILGGGIRVSLSVVGSSNTSNMQGVVVGVAFKL